MTWNKLRQLALERDNHQCERCGNLYGLQAHHKKYPAETINDIQILCRNCHYFVHYGKEYKIEPHKWKKEELENHCEQGRTLREIGNIFNTSYERIRQKLNYFHLKTKKKKKPKIKINNIKIPKLKCKRCGYKWIPRKEEVIVCPRCKSPYWNVERRKK